MTERGKTEPHLRIAHVITEAIMQRDFSKRQRKVLDLILRLSWGCGKQTAIIPNLQDFDIVGVGKTHIRTELDWLIQSRVIAVEGNEYSFNATFDDWQVSRTKPFNPSRLTDLVTLNIRNGYHKGNKPVTVSVTDADTKADTGKEKGKKDTTPIGVHAVFRLYEELTGEQVPFYGKEGKSIKRAIDMGYSPEDIIGCWQALKEDTFWQGKWLPFSTVAEHLGAFKKGALKDGGKGNGITGHKRVRASRKASDFGLPW